MDKLVIVAIVMALTGPSLIPADGATDYKAQCARCHGADGKGNAKLAKALKVDEGKLNLTGSAMSEADQVTITEKGKAKMPAFGTKITKEQIAAVVKFSMGLPK